MKRLATAWMMALIVLMALGVWRGGLESGAQETVTDSDGLMTQIADAHGEEGDLLDELAAAHATEVANLAATATALEDQLAAAEATSAARASEVAVLQTQVVDLEAELGGRTAPTGVEVGMGEVASAGPWDFTVLSVERGEVIDVDPEDATDAAEAQGIFLVVELEFVNTGTDAQTYDPTWFRVTDDRGRSWPFDFTQTDTLSLAGAGARQYQAIQPGLATTAAVVFDIAPDATGLTLRTKEDLAGTSEPWPDPFTIRMEE